MLSQYYNSIGHSLFVSKFNLSNVQQINFLKKLSIVTEIKQKNRSKYKLILIFSIFMSMCKPFVVTTGNKKLFKIPTIEVKFSKKHTWLFFTRFLFLIYSSQEENKEIFLKVIDHKNPIFTILDCNSHFEIDKLFSYLKIEWFERINIILNPTINSFSSRHSEFFLNFLKFPVFFK